MIYSPDSIMSFGINKGQVLSEIYKYYPSYLKWLIDNVKNFCIAIDEFKCLPIPTPFNEDINLQAKYHAFFDKFLNELITQRPLNKLEELIDEATKRRDEYFDVSGMEAFNNVVYAKRIVSRLKVEPQASVFSFGKECIRKNALKKSRFMTKSRYDKQNQNLLLWGEKIKLLSKKFAASEQEELNSLQKIEEDVEEALYEEMRDQERDLYYKSIENYAYEDDPDNFWNTD